MQDTTLNMLITFEEDDDYEDPEHILDEPTPEELLIEEEEEEEVEQLTARMAALPTPEVQHNCPLREAQHHKCPLQDNFQIDHCYCEVTPSNWLHLQVKL